MLRFRGISVGCPGEIITILPVTSTASGRRADHDDPPFEGEDGMTDALERRIVPFYDDELIAVQRADSTIYVLFTRSVKT